MKVTKTTFLAQIVLLAVLLIGCASSQYRMGWIEVRDENSIRCSYSRFDGKEKVGIKAEEGQEFRLSTDVEVSEGVLTIQLFDPDDSLVWEERSAEDNAKVENLVLKTSGQYKLIITGDDTNGSFDISWEEK